MAIQDRGRKAIQAFVDRGTEFRHRSLAGVHHDGEGYEFGALPDQWRAQLATAQPYRVLYSYDTPIAWWSPNTEENDGWTVPDVFYSRTTTNHQNVARFAIRHGYYE